MFECNKIKIALILKKIKRKDEKRKTIARIPKNKLKNIIKCNSRS
jgi:hypothetical protein